MHHLKPRKSFRDGWFVFDLSLVLTAYVEQTIQFFTASRSEQQAPNTVKQSNTSQALCFEVVSFCVLMVCWLFEKSSVVDVSSMFSPLQVLVLRTMRLFRLIRTFRMPWPQNGFCMHPCFLTWDWRVAMHIWASAINVWSREV